MDWDWESITTGEWWVVVIALATLVLGAVAGYVAGLNKAREEYRRAAIRTTGTTYPPTTLE